MSNMLFSQHIALGERTLFKKELTVQTFVKWRVNTFRKTNKNSLSLASWRSESESWDLFLLRKLRNNILSFWKVFIFYMQIQLFS